MDSHDSPSALSIIVGVNGRRAVDFEWILGLILFGILYQVLAIVLLQDLVNRDRVLGGHQAPWFVIIIFITFVGSLYISSVIPRYSMIVIEDRVCVLQCPFT
jgi:hypothetical protein